MIAVDVDSTGPIVVPSLLASKKRNVDWAIAAEVLVAMITSVKAIPQRGNLPTRGQF